MADVLPDYNLEMQKKIHQLAGLRLNYERDKLEVMELRSRIIRAEINMMATVKAVAEMEKDISQLEETHGPVPTLLPTSVHQEG